jgi:hypothetical protein
MTTKTKTKTKHYALRLLGENTMDVKTNQNQKSKIKKEQKNKQNAPLVHCELRRLGASEGAASPRAQERLVVVGGCVGAVPDLRGRRVPWVGSGLAFLFCFFFSLYLVSVVFIYLCFVGWL